MKSIRSTKQNPAPPGPEPVKQRAATERLRRRIIRGTWAPGDRLPGRRELCRELNLSLTTVQEALRELIRTGYAEARSTSGTFVTTRPPHLHLFGLVMPEDIGPNRFHAAIHGEAVRLIAEPDRRLAVWTHVAPPFNRPALRGLIEGVEARGFAGLIFPQIGQELSESPIVQTPGVPRVSFGSLQTVENIGHVARLELDYDSFIEESLRAILATGRRKIAILCHAGQTHDPFLRAMRGRLPIPPRHWLHTAGLTSPDTARSLIHLLFHRSQKQRPDALWITDDNLVEAATAGLLDGGVRVPKDLHVVAHCNFPWLTTSHVSARRVGFDATQAIHACLELLQQQRAQIAGKPTAHPAPMSRRIVARAQ